MKRPMVLVWLFIIFSWSGVIWLVKAGDSSSQNSQIFLFLLLFFALTFLISFFVFLARIIIRRDQDERVVFRSSFWWTTLFVSVTLTGKFLETRAMLDYIYVLLLIGIAFFGSMFLRLGAKRRY